MKHLLLSTALVAMIPASASVAATVYPGCAVPALKPGHHTFYVDPAKGSGSGDGSAAKPWRTLSEVLFNGTKLVASQSSKTVNGVTSLVDTNPNGPIKAGDVIMLKSGDHGDVKFTGLFNADFITVMPAPGEKPVIRSLALTSDGKWIFQGLKFMPGVSKARPGGIIAIGYGDWQGPTHDIIFDSNTVSTVDDTSGWSPMDWKNNTQGTAIWSTQGMKCLAVTANRISNTLNGIALSATDSLAQGNIIQRVFNDGIDITASNLIVKGNVITGGTNNQNDGYHADGIQGWSANIKGVIQTNSNVLIDSNTIIKFGSDPSISYMQGITVFDGKWKGLTIQNNLIAVNHINGLVLMGTEGSRVINNTVIGTGPSNFLSWIQLRNGKSGTVSSNAVVRNNISSRLSIEGNNMTADHNIAALSIGLPGGKPITSGSIGVTNKIVSNITSQFVAFNTKDQVVDFRIKPTSSGVGAGTSADAPRLDINGKVRASPFDLGAYAH